MAEAGTVLLARPYDRVSALLDGRVSIREDLTCALAASTPEAFRRLAADDTIIAGEMSLGFQVASVASRTVSPFVALPVFLSRSFRHGNIFVRSDSPLTDLAELKGKRIGLEEYAMTMGIWVRGLLADAGVRPEDIHWFTARSPILVPEVEAKLKQTLRMERAERPVFELLRSGEIDAVIGRPPNFAEVEGGAFRRLLADHWAHQRAYFARTRIFPTMHVLVLRREAWERDPGLALDLYHAFVEAKRLLFEEMRTNLNSLITTLPMLEAHVDETRALFGEDWWPYGIADNRPTLDAFLRFCFEQDVIPRRVGLDEVFCANLLDS
jgi:4,5-dihydroxyphthalate decarboxylase